MADLDLIPDTANYLTVPERESETIEKLVRLVNGQISFGSSPVVHGARTGNINGQFLKVTFPATPGELLEIPHGLDRVPNIALAGWISLDATVYCSAIQKSNWSEEAIYLACSAASAQAILVVL